MVFKNQYFRCTISIRDILTWVYFINTLTHNNQEPDALPSVLEDCDTKMDTTEACSSRKLPLALSYIHGACMVFLDGLGAGKLMMYSNIPCDIAMAALFILIHFLAKNSSYWLKHAQHKSDHNTMFILFALYIINSFF